MKTKKERKYMPVWVTHKLMTGELQYTEKLMEKYSSGDGVFQYLVDNKDRYAAESRLKAKHIVYVTVRDEEHYHAIIEHIMNNISLRSDDFGFSEMVITELRKTKQSVSFEMHIYKDMPEGFDPVVYGNELNSLLTND